MKRQKRKALSLILAIAMLVSSTALTSNAAISTATPDPVTQTPYTQADVENLYTGVYNFNLDWLYYEPPTRLGPSSNALPTVLNQTKDGNDRYFYDPAYDDSSWEKVSVPHAFNSKYMYQRKATSSGDRGVYQGFVLYRKHFELPPEAAGKKVFIEFEGIKHASYVYLNGVEVGYYEAGVTAFGFDLSAVGSLNYDGPNVLAVAADNRTGSNLTSMPAVPSEGLSAIPGDPSGSGWKNSINETLPGSAMGAQDGVNGFRWFNNDFNPSQGGITQDVRLYIKDQVFQTLPLYRNLRTQGVYIYPSNINASQKTATINIESEVRNETGAASNIAMDVVLVGMDGRVAYSCSFGAAAVAAASDVELNKSINMTAVTDTLNSTTTNANNEKVDLSGAAFRDTTVLSVSFDVADLNLWSTYDPYLYDVYTILKRDGDVIDVVKTTTGFRKVEFKTGADGGVFINDQYVWLTGYAQRSTNEWAAIGVANDWLTDYEMQLVRESNANFIRWMHIAPPPKLIRSGDKYGIVSTVPAGDKEDGNVNSRMWNQRMEVMRDVIIYFRNSPSVLFWEIGNGAPDDNSRLTKMMEIKNKLDPSGMRAMGCRSIGSAASQLVEYVGTMLGRQVYWNGRFQGTGGQTARDNSLIQETEYTRDEAPKRVWDNYSPPYFQYRNNFAGSNDTPDSRVGQGYDAWDFTTEDFIVQGVENYNEFYSRQTQGGSPQIYSAAAALNWSDSNMHGRQTGSETGRMSGRVDALRLPKQSYYAYQTMQSGEPSVYLVGHWNYPPDDGGTDPGDNYVYENRTPGENVAGGGYKWNGTYSKRDPTRKTIYVVASNVASVELFVNGVSAGVRAKSQASNNFLYSWNNINILTRGSIYAVGYDDQNAEVTRMTIETVDTPTALRLTPRTGPDGFIADGGDLAFIDVEVVDAEGRVHPLNSDKISFRLLSGDVTIMGGYNGGLDHFVNYDSSQSMYFSGSYRWEPGYNTDHFYAENGVNRLFLKAGRTPGNIEIEFTLHRTNDDGTTTPITGTVTLPTKSIGMDSLGVTSVMPQSIRPGAGGYDEADITVNYSGFTSLVSGYAANIPVTAAANDEADASRTILAGVYLNGNLASQAAEVVNGSARLRIEAAEFSSAVLKAWFEDDPGLTADVRINVRKLPVDIWAPGIEVADGKTAVTFGSKITLNGTTVTFGGNPVKSFRISDVFENQLVIDEAMQDGGTAVISKIKYPELFPSYSFTFTLTYKAPEEFTVTFMSDEAEYASVKVLEGRLLGDMMPANPQKDGFAFLGWILEDGTAFTAGTAVTGNITVYAAWAKEFTVTFMVDDAEYAAVKALDGKSLGNNMPANPQKDELAFNGWVTALNGGTAFTAGTAVTGDITVYATFVVAEWKTVIHEDFSGDGPYAITGGGAGLGTGGTLSNTGSIGNDGDRKTFDVSGTGSNSGLRSARGSLSQTVTPGEEGFVRLTFDWWPGAPEVSANYGILAIESSQYGVRPPDGSTSAVASNHRIISLIANNGVLYFKTTQFNDWNNASQGLTRVKTGLNAWYKVEVILDFTNRKIELRVSNDGNDPDTEIFTVDFDPAIATAADVSSFYFGCTRSSGNANWFTSIANLEVSVK